MSNTNNTTNNGSNYGTKRGGGRRGFTLIEILIVVVILGVLAALVIPGVTGALTDANNNAATARASQISTMVTRLNSMKPTINGTKWAPTGKFSTIMDPANTTDVSFSVSDLQPIVDAGYCSAADIENQLGSNKGWVYNATNKKFEPET